MFSKEDVSRICSVTSDCFQDLRSLWSVFDVVRVGRERDAEGNARPERAIQSNENKRYLRDSRFTLADLAVLSDQRTVTFS
jgi:hypothetical protein